MNFSWFRNVLCLMALSGCQGNAKLEPVIGRVGGANADVPTETELVTRSAPGGGVQLSTRVAGDQRAVTLDGIEAVRLIDALERELAAWTVISREPPFERVIAAGITRVSDWNPYSVELVRRIEMSAPVFLISIGHAEERAVVVLDGQNAARWTKRLRNSSGY